MFGRESIIRRCQCDTVVLCVSRSAEECPLRHRLALEKNTGSREWHNAICHCRCWAVFVFWSQLIKTGTRRCFTSTLLNVSRLALLPCAWHKRLHSEATACICNSLRCVSDKEYRYSALIEAQRYGFDLKSEITSLCSFHTLLKKGWHSQTLCVSL